MVPPASARGPPREHAYEEALHRKIGELEMRASEALRDGADADAAQYRAMVAHMKKEAESQERTKEYAASLKGQMAESETRRRHQVVAEKAPENTSVPQGLVVNYVDIRAGRNRDLLTSEARAACAQQPGAPASNVRSFAPKAYEKQALELRKALEDQIQDKQARKAEVKRFERTLDECMVEAQKQEIALVRQREEAAKQEERETLGVAWREEAKIRSIKRTVEAIERGQRVPMSARDPVSCGASAVNSLSAAGRSIGTPRMTPPGVKRFPIREVA